MSAETENGRVGILTEDATVMESFIAEPPPQESALPSAFPSSQPEPARGAQSASSVSSLGPERTPTSGQKEEREVQVKGRQALQCSIPGYVCAALLVLLVVEVLAVTGSIYYIRGVRNDERRTAAEVARTSARAIETLLDHLVAPMLSLANYVQVEPHWPTLNASFDKFARAVYTTNPYYQIEVCPYGLVLAMAMPSVNLTGDALQQLYLQLDYGIDMLSPARDDLQFNIESILQDNQVILLGPWYADGELSEGAFVVRYSIFLPKGEWDMPPSNIHICPSERCNKPNGDQWWGFSNAVFAWKTVAPAVHRLAERGLLYTLSPDPRAQNQSFLAKSMQLPDPDECMVVGVSVYGWMSWEFCVEPIGGFGPPWRVGLLVGVTALAVLLAILVGLVMRSRQKAVEAHGRQLELNRQLAVAKEEAVEGRRVIEAEKQVMDALLQRQRDLIALFGKEDERLAATAGGSMSDDERGRLQHMGSSSVELSRESAAYDRIEALRRQLTVNRSSTKQIGTGGEDLKLGEILGEGTFGKVFKGEWRGTEVAVKTMVLPANMSGAEKREKMALMEIATGAALTHPHVVQTYTYFIRSVREQGPLADEGPSPRIDGILVGHGPENSETGVGPNSGKAFDEPSARTTSSPAAHAVHGYEVRLVLEYCDRGCLRDALDGDAFLSAEGVNYRGVLDTAADIAKAMLHLHAVDLLHGDLKARNVMLKSGGVGEGRGVICKVADFGLSVKMDTAEQTHMSGMYQGTLTHMSPEVMLMGRISKAADVYAYGITLWELFVGGHAFQGVPRALLGHHITVERKRPAFPPFAPEAYTRLACDCWAHAAEARPTFDKILERLAAMRAELPGPAAPLGAYRIGAPPLPPPRFSNGGTADSGMIGLPKLAIGLQTQMSATSNPVFDSSQFSGSPGTGSGITWPFAGSFRAPLPVVIEENEHDASSKRLPMQPPGASARPPHEDARAMAELDASNTPLGRVLEDRAAP